MASVKERQPDDEYGDQEQWQEILVEVRAGT